MLRAGRMDEFVTEEDEPWYDQRDLEQGEIKRHKPHQFDNKDGCVSEWQTADKESAHCVYKQCFPLSL